MNKAKVIIAVVLCSILSSCGLFRKQDRCPSVGQANPGVSVKK
jgi:hypothetical protein